MARDVARDWMWSEACEMLARAERMHREIFRPAAAHTRQVTWEPPVDILETDREVMMYLRHEAGLPLFAQFFQGHIAQLIHTTKPLG